MTRRHAVGSAAALALTGFVVLAVYLTDPESLGIRTRSALVLALTLLALVALCVVRGTWSAPAVAGIVIAVFHVPLSIFPLIGGTPDLSGAPTAWFYQPVGARAQWLAVLGVLSFAVGALLVPPRSRKPVAGPGTVPSADRVGTLGFWVVSAAVGSWVIFVAQSLGWTFFLVSYDAFRTATAPAPLIYIYYLMSIGLALLAMDTDERKRRRGLMVFAAFAVAAFPLGLRGEVLFPLVVYAVVAARHRSMPSLWKAVAAALVVLSLVSFVKDLRQVGIADYRAQDVVQELSPLDGLAELGYSLRTVAEVESWHAMGTPLRDGATYGAPVERLLGRIGVTAEPPPAAVDTRLMNIEMRQRAGNLGGSIIAEADRNFGRPGVVGVLMFAGLVLAIAERSRRAVIGDMILAVVLTALLQHVRNSFTPVPLQLALGILVVAAARVTTRTTAPGPGGGRRQPGGASTREGDVRAAGLRTRVRVRS